MSPLIFFRHNRNVMVWCLRCKRYVRTFEEGSDFAVTSRELARVDQEHEVVHPPGGWIEDMFPTIHDAVYYDEDEPG